ncbi:hypothetical protein P6F26_08695 [Roseibacterium sp. SDUM158017]|uniref:hypothetical protein n=1 Tax=Roseicyclus salinarum TaxID=3036773 RepID=UPI002415176D|nr:hypothetical protein [Roseibacterium sp. SDUM158017]MDG4648523.1 hypothetical protein [Roseibacterium sp. SDUM158017]
MIERIAKTTKGKWQTPTLETLDVGRTLTDSPCAPNENQTGNGASNSQNPGYEFCS